MTCPNLVEWIEWVILICKAGERPYVPNSSELQEYCKNEDYNQCPYYLKVADNELLNLQLREIQLKIIRVCL